MPVVAAGVLLAGVVDTPAALGTDSATWGPVEVARAGERAVRAPALGPGPADGAWLVWEEGPDIMAARRDGSGWTAPERVATGYAADLAVDDSNVPHVVFVNDIVDAHEVYYVRRDATGWSLPRSVGGALLAVAPTVAVGGGTIFVAWEQAGRLYAASSFDGIVWSSGPVLVNDMLVRGRAPAVVADQSGAASLVWHSLPDDGPTHVYHAGFDGARWRPAERLSVTAGGSLADVAQLSGHELLVAWLGLDQGITAVVGHSETWRWPAEVAPAGSARGQPAAAGGADGGHVVWRAAAAGVGYRWLVDGWWQAPTAVAGNVAHAVAATVRGDGRLQVAWAAPAGGDAARVLSRAKLADMAAPSPTPTAVEGPTTPPPTTPSATITPGGPTLTPPGVTTTPTPTGDSAAPTNTPADTAGPPGPTLSPTASRATTAEPTVSPRPTGSQRVFLPLVSS